MGAEDKGKSPGPSPTTSRKSSTDEEKEREKASRKESLRQAGHRDSKTETQGHEAPGTRDTAPIQPPSPLPEETKLEQPPALSASMVNEILNRLNEIRSRKSNLEDK